MNDLEKYLQFSPVGKFTKAGWSLLVGIILAVVAWSSNGLGVWMGEWVLLISLPLSIYAGFVIGWNLGEIEQERK